ncbi:hypothetical protein PZA11_000215 [Diplocarpon coronariae]
MKLTSTLSLLLSTSLSSASPLVLKQRDLTADTQDDVVNGVCKQHTVIFARGTTAPGNVGDSAGPPFFQAIESLVGTGNLAVQGVNYDASIEGFLQGGDPQGGVTAVSIIEQAFTQCPDTKLVFSGYSQGAQIVHNAAKDLSAATTAKISSVVTFGDPYNGTAVGTVPASRTLIICHNGDNICEGGILIGPAHGNYSANAAQAAKFVVAQAAL